MVQRIAARFIVFVLVLVAGCAAPPPAQDTASESSAPTPTTASSPGDTTADDEAASDQGEEQGEQQGEDQAQAQELRVVNVAFPYIPNVQFAPYYVASSQGYYTDAGLEVTFEYMFENEAVQLVAQEKADFGFLSGISVLLARQSDMPVVTVATITHEFPVVFFSTADTPLAGVQDLREHRIGIPGQFGASYYGLLAVLYANDMQESDLELHDIGFNQVSMLLEDKVDVAVGYAMNEPVQLREMGEDVSVLHVADIYPLVSDGIITHEEVIANDPDLVRSFVQATLQGVEYLLANPDEAFEISLEHIPEADLGDVDFQRKVFDASIPYWQSDAPGLSNVELWTQTHTFLLDSGLLSEPVEIESSVTNEFVE